MDVIETYEPTNILKTVADDVWIVDGPVIKFGYMGLKLPFPTRMTIVKLADGGLWVHSPTALTSSLKEQIDTLGQIRYLIAPNRIHYWWIEDWVGAYPGAETYAAPGVREQARDNDRFTDYKSELTEGDRYPWSGDLDMLVVVGGYMSEAVFFHKASRTLLLTDLIENFEREKIASPFFKFVSKFSGGCDPNGKMPIDLRLTFFMHRRQMANAVRTMISWQPQRILIAHGRWYPENAVSELKRAFSWLPGITP